MLSKLLFLLLLLSLLVSAAVCGLDSADREKVLNNLLLARSKLEDYERQYSSVMKQLSALEEQLLIRGEKLKSLRKIISDYKNTQIALKQTIDEQKNYIDNLERVLAEDTATSERLQDSLKKASKSYKQLQTSRDVWRIVGITGGVVAILTAAAAITLDALNVELIE